MDELVPVAPTTAEVVRLDEAIHGLERTVSLDHLRASGRTAFRLVSRRALMREVLSVVEVFVETRLRAAESKIGEAMREREMGAREEGKLRVLASLVDLADMADALIQKLEGGSEAVAAKALDRRIDAVFRTHGFERILAVGETFDATFHEVVTEESDPAAGPDVVLREVGRGYRREAYVLRPARVVVNERED
jgi:hypothetical protein